MEKKISGIILYHYKILIHIVQNITRNIIRFALIVIKIVVNFAILVTKRRIIDIKIFMIYYHNLKRKKNLLYIYKMK